MDPEEVDEIPTETNGKKLYKIKTTTNKFCDDTRDDRYFVMRNSSKTTFPGITKTGVLSRQLSLSKQETSIYVFINRETS